MLAPLSVVLDVLDVAGVALHAAKAERGPPGDQPADLHRGGLAGDAEPVRSDVGDDQHREDLPGSGRRIRELFRVAGVVDHHGEIVRRRVQRHEPPDLVLAEHGRGQQEAVQPARRHRLGLAQLGAAQADRAGLHLAPADRDRLVRLSVRPQPDAALPRQRRHGRDVVVEGVEVEDQRRRVETPS